MWEKKNLDSTKSTLTSGIIMCWERIDKREGSEQGRVYWDQKWYEHTVQRVSTESRKYTEGNDHRQDSSQHFNIYIINLNWSGHSGVFWLLAHLPSQLLLHVVEVLAVFVHQAQQFNHVICRTEGKVKTPTISKPSEVQLWSLVPHMCPEGFFLQKKKQGNCFRGSS